MAEEHDGSPDRTLPLERREFLQLGLAGTALRGDVVDQYVDAAAARSTSGTDGDARHGDAETPPSDRREYFPVAADTLSVRGLAPDAATPVGAAVRESDGRFSVQRLAAEHRIDHDRPSVRELVTPQVEGPPPDANRTTWDNWLDDYEVENAADVTVPGSSDAQRDRLIQLVVRKAEGKFRAVGSGHSHSDAAAPKKFFSDLKEASGLLDQSWLRSPDAQFWDDTSVTRDHLVRLQAGTVLKRLNRDVLDGTGLALPNMGAWDGQTLAGAINTGTHGTGLDLGSFADIVRSVEIVAVPESRYEDGEPQVRMFRIERSEGITDPEAFAKDASEHRMALIQNDEVFHSVVMGYGSMGMAYAYTLELRDHYWLHEENTIKRLDAFDPLEYARSNRHFNINVDLIPPQVTGASNPPCLLRTQNLAEPGGREPTERAHGFDFVENVKDAFLDAWKDISKLDLASDNFSVELADLLTIDLLELTGLDPPFENARHETAWHVALRRFKEENPDPDVPPEVPQESLTTEIGIPVDQVKPALRDLVAFVKDSDRFFPAPASVRYVSGSEHYLSPEYDRPTAMVEFVVPQFEWLQEEFDEVEINKDGGLGPVYLAPKKIFFQKLKKHNYETGNLDHFLDLSEAKKELRTVERTLVKNYDGRPHLGKFNSVDVNADDPDFRPQNMFPEYEKWLDAQRYFNRYGTFDGEFTDNKVRD